MSISPTFYAPAFALIFLRQKSSNLTFCKYKKAAQQTFIQKKLHVKCWWNWHLVLLARTKLKLLEGKKAVFVVKHKKTRNLNLKQKHFFAIIFLLLGSHLRTIISQKPINFKWMIISPVSIWFDAINVQWNSVITSSVVYLQFFRGNWLFYYTNWPGCNEPRL